VDGLWDNGPKRNFDSSNVDFLLMEPEKAMKPLPTSFEDTKVLHKHDFPSYGAGESNEAAPCQLKDTNALHVQ
jgi:hypothetical protein